MPLTVILCVSPCWAGQHHCSLIFTSLRDAFFLWCAAHLRGSGKFPSNRKWSVCARHTRRLSKPSLFQAEQIENGGSKLVADSLLRLPLGAELTAGAQAADKTPVLSIANETNDRKWTNGLTSWSPPPRDGTQCKRARGVPHDDSKCSLLFHFANPFKKTNSFTNANILQ